MGCVVSIVTRSESIVNTHPTLLSVAKCEYIKVNLKWLDLSFNSISKIEGLDNLKYLSDLSFSYNRISRIEGLDSLVNLQTLSLAHNKLEVKEDIFYLRPFNFPKLRSVALWGNPLADVSF